MDVSADDFVVLFKGHALLSGGGEGAMHYVPLPIKINYYIFFFGGGEEEEEHAEATS